MESDVTQSATFIKLWAWVHANVKQVMVGAVVVIVIGIVVGFIFWRQSARQLAANEALAQVLVSGYTRTPEGPQAMLKVAEEYPNTAAAGRALLIGGGKLFTEGKYADAEAQFKKYLHDYPDSPSVSDAQLGVAACLDATGKTNDAVTAYKEIVERRPNEVVAAPARLALARLYEAQGQLKQAHDQYAQVLRTSTGTMQQEAAMRLDQLLERHPELAPAASTNLPILNMK